MPRNLLAGVALGLAAVVAVPHTVSRAGATEAVGALHDVHAAERPDGHPPRGPQRAEGRGQRLVPRRRRTREAGTHRLRAPVRAPHVRGLRTRQRRRVRHAARGGRRHRTTGRRRATGPTTTRRCPRTRSTWRSSSSPIAWATCSTSSRPQLVDSQRDVVKNERRQSYENAPYGMAFIRIVELLYPKGHPYQLAGHRLHGGSQRGDARGRDRVLQDVLRAGQRESRRRRRHQPGRRRASVEYWFGDVKAGAQSADP